MYTHADGHLKCIYTEMSDLNKQFFFSKQAIKIYNRMIENLLENLQSMKGFEKH